MRTNPAAWQPEGRHEAGAKEATRNGAKGGRKGLDGSLQPSDFCGVAAFVSRKRRFAPESWVRSASRPLFSPLARARLVPGSTPALGRSASRPRGAAWKNAAAGRWLFPQVGRGGAPDSARGGRAPRDPWRCRAIFGGDDRPRSSGIATNSRPAQRFFQMAVFCAKADTRAACPHRALPRHLRWWG